MAKPEITVLLPTYNCAAIVRNTLESIKWASDLLVVDSFSSDGTLDICREYGARIVQHEYINSAKQKNWALRHCRSEWIFQIDSDEVIEEGLREEMEQAISEAPPAVHAFRMPRKNHVLGRWMRYGGLYPDYQTRLYRRAYGRWSDREVHAHVQVPGKVVDLTHHVVHYGMETISKQLRNLDRYTRYEADELHGHGGGFHLYQLMFLPIFQFCHRYLYLKGFCDGMRGFILSAYSSIYFFLLLAKLWELEELELDHSPK